jgi:hypothetical protein
MIRVVRVVVAVRQDDLGPARAVLLRDRIDERVSRAERIVSGIEEADLATKESGGALRLGATDCLHAVDRHAWFLPCALALAALAVREAENVHAVAA